MPRPAGYTPQNTAPRVVRIWANLPDPSQFIVITSLTKSHICVKFVLSLDFLFAHCLFLKVLIRLLH